MKKVGLMALLTVGTLFYGCESFTCNIPEDDNYRSKTEYCNRDSTLEKFVGEWIGTPGAYPVTITKVNTNEYALNVTTNLGLTDGSGNPRTPVSLNNWQVIRNKAFLSKTSFYEGEIEATITYTSNILMGIDYTLSGFGIPYDNSYSEILSK